MTNRKIINCTFRSIMKSGFIPYDVQYGNAYFIFEMGENSVVHFKIRGLRGWKFGMWLNQGDMALQFFTQHEDYIDKFKPSRSFFCVEYAKKDIKGELNCDPKVQFFEILEILRHIKKNPIVAYEQNANDEAYSQNNYYVSYIKDKCSYYKQTVKKKYEDLLPVIRHKYKVNLMEKYDFVDKVEFRDNNKGGWICYPRYEMIIHFKKIYDEDEQNSKEYDLLRKFFKKKLWEYQNITINCRRDDIKGLYSYRFE